MPFLWKRTISSSIKEVTSLNSFRRHQSRYLCKTQYGYTNHFYGVSTRSKKINNWSRWITTLENQVNTRRRFQKKLSYLNSGLEGFYTSVTGENDLYVKMLTILEVPLGWKQLIGYHDLGKFFFEENSTKIQRPHAIFKSFNYAATFNLLFWLGSCKTRLVETWDQVQFEQVWCAIHKNEGNWRIGDLFTSSKWRNWLFWKMINIPNFLRLELMYLKFKIKVKNNSR